MLLTTDTPVSNYSETSIPDPGDTVGPRPASTRKNRILIVDDNVAIHDDFRKILENKRRPLKSKAAEAFLFGESVEIDEHFDLEIDSAHQGQEALALVEKSVLESWPYLLAFVDVRMPPGWDGIETVSRLWKIDPRIQIVLCTAYSDYSWKEIIEKLGRTDKLLILKKPFDILEVHQLVCSLTEKWELARRLEAHLSDLEGLVQRRTAEVENSLSIIQATLEATADGILFIDQEGRPVAYNRRFIEMWQIPPAAIAHQSQLSLFLGSRVDSEKFKNAFSNLEGDIQSNEFDLLKLEDGRIFEWSFQTQKIGQSNNGRVWTFRDVTKRVALEEQLRQSQKMECVGQLAGGVAHDFNNMLTVIRCHAVLLIDTATDLEKESLKEVISAAQRAANLTRQLLSFSRRQIAHMIDLDLHQVITSSSRMLKPLIGEDIEFKLDVPSDLPLVHADMGMMEQVLMNLAINARDAMPEGGTLTIRVCDCIIDAGQASLFADATAGDYVRIEVSDMGCGIAAENLARIFEPFFTTKDVGKGTGLGLATVYGIVKQHKGWITVQSEIGTGTTFRIFLPAIKNRVAQVIEPSGKNKMARGHETILLVEDETPVRNLTARILKGLGYRILEAPSAVQALELLPNNEIDLLLTDMVMPEGMNGRELAERMAVAQPGAKIVFVSGYSPDIFQNKLDLKQGHNFLQKPYSPEALAQIVRARLDEKPAA